MRVWEDRATSGRIKSGATSLLEEAIKTVSRGICRVSLNIPFPSPFRVTDLSSLGPSDGLPPRPPFPPVSPERRARSPTCRTPTNQFCRCDASGGEIVLALLGRVEGGPCGLWGPRVCVGVCVGGGCVWVCGWHPHRPGLPFRTPPLLSPSSGSGG